METVRNKHASFCFGVKKAVDRVLKEIGKREGKEIYTLGPIIHNPQMVSMLKDKGIIPVDDLNSVYEGTVVFRTHGIKKEEEEYIKKKGLESIDVTCPFVKRVRKHAVYLRNHGYQVVIIGDKNHPEVKSVLSYLDNDGIVMQEPCPIEARKIGVVSQTTLDWDTFTGVITGLLNGAEEVRIYDTICRSTQVRQREAAELAGLVDVMLIIGGKNSSNTTKLYKIAKKVQPKTYHIETDNDIQADWFKGTRKVGLIGGSSTPDFIIDLVDRRVKNL
jgi:(E)-4-hydroxy-3-methyl-but-2-enyl pyrophosphate reductase